MFTKKAYSSADINRKNKAGSTALMFAYYNGSVSVANILLDKGADEHVTNNTGWTPLMFKEQHARFADIIKDVGSRPTPAEYREITLKDSVKIGEAYENPLVFENGKAVIPKNYELFVRDARGKQLDIALNAVNTEQIQTKYFGIIKRESPDVATLSPKLYATESQIKALQAFQILVYP